ncbi:EthD family reductase [Risungbinella massiliensis]|uniref:EthD family reductase n=1 Tax=Risungbinella massiliensis TaxID=1329796 RepID=UPI0005CBB027|nr:EthD family reductase [Risungbinella massiliensis]
MIKVIAFFNPVQDSDSFAQYFEEHMVPKFLTLPGVIKMNVTRILDQLVASNPNPYFMYTEIYYPSLEAYENGFVHMNPDSQQILQEFMDLAGHISVLNIGTEHTYRNLQTSTAFY